MSQLTQSELCTRRVERIAGLLRRFGLVVAPEAVALELDCGADELVILIKILNSSLEVLEASGVDI